MTDAIETAAGDLMPGKRYNLTLKHGDSDRVLENAEVRSFQPYLSDDPDKSDETLRFEAEGELVNKSPGGEPYTEHLTIGFDPANVASFTEL